MREATKQRPVSVAKLAEVLVTRPYMVLAALIQRAIFPSPHDSIDDCVAMEVASLSGVDLKIIDDDDGGAFESPKGPKVPLPPPNSSSASDQIQEAQQDAQSNGGQRPTSDSDFLPRCGSARRSLGRMLRHLIIFLFCAGLSCCQKNSSSEGILEQSFAITKGTEDGLNAVKSLAFEAKAWETSKAQSKEQGWKAVGAVGEQVRPNTSFKNAAEELAYYGSVIFRCLGYPLQDTPGSGFTLKTNREVAIRHRKEALEDFGLLLERWMRSREERWNDMLHGKK